MAGIPGNDNDSKKIPLWYGSSKDAFLAEHWIKRLEAARTSNSWTPEQLVSHAHSALRERALLFRDYLESENLQPDDWEHFKAAFLKHFGTQTRDTSKVTCLTLTQKVDERVNYFGFRVSTAVQEFLSSVPTNTPDLTHPRLNTLPDNILAAIDDPAHRSLIISWGQQLVQQSYKTWSQGNSSSLGRVIFLNGLLPNIRMISKLKETNSLDAAITAAMRAERASIGPVDRSNERGINEMTEDLDPNDPDVNFIKKGGKFYKGTTQKKKHPECWYCHKKNHIQTNCRLRLQRGASMVPKPRTVQEIQHERMASK